MTDLSYSENEGCGNVNNHSLVSFLGLLQAIQGKSSTGKWLVLSPSSAGSTPRSCGLLPAKSPGGAGLHVPRDREWVVNTWPHGTIFPEKATRAKSQGLCTKAPSLSAILAPLTSDFEK